MQNMAMISGSTIGAIIVGIILLLIVPAALLVVLSFRKKIGMMPLGLGFASFFVSQVLLRIPLLSVLGSNEAFAQFASAYALIFSLVVGGFSAGLFEETARLGGAMILRKDLSFRNVFSFGLGHGVCEVMVLVGFNYINLLILALVVNASPDVLAASLGEGQLALVVEQLQSVTPVMVFWATVERVSAVLLHLFNTALVFRAAKDKKPMFYLFALLLHTVFNFGASLLAPISVALCELVLLAAGLACGWGMLRAKAWFAKT